MDTGRPVEEECGTRFIEDRCAGSKRSLFRRLGLIAAVILASWGLGAATHVLETVAQVPGVWGGPGVAPPTAPAPPVGPYYYPGPTTRERSIPLRPTRPTISIRALASGCRDTTTLTATGSSATIGTNASAIPTLSG